MWTVYRVWNILARPESETWQEWGPLEADHTWVFKFKEKVEKDEDDILAAYSPDGKMADCTVTSPGGQIVPDAQQPLVAYDTHTTDEIESAYKRWFSRKSKESASEQEDE